MTLIHTGFELNSHRGAMKADDALCRYFPIQRFYQLLETRSLWFTRVLNWRLDDPCEATLLPVFRNELLRNHRGSKAAVNWMVADLELGLKSSYGCCFMLSDGHEAVHMWKIYCPAHSNFGVLVRFHSSAVANAIQQAPYRHRFFRRVEYLSDAEASALSLQETRHSYHPANSSYFNAWESIFFKRRPYESEREVRAIVSNGTFRRAYLLSFAARHHVPMFEYAPEALDPSNIPEGILRVAIEDGSGNGFCLELDDDKTSQLIHEVEGNLEQSFPELREQTGAYLQFDLNSISQIVVHPDIWNSSELSTLKSKTDAYSLTDRLFPSDLVKTKWY